jgi:roadblock/LC7 domain-containing protein
MIGLDRLIKLPGVIAAGQFDEKGEVLRSVGDLSNEMSFFIAHTIKSKSNQISEMTKELADKIDKSWLPFNGWAFWGRKYSMCIVGKTGVIV